MGYFALGFWTVGLVIISYLVNHVLWNLSRRKYYKRLVIATSLIGWLVAVIPTYVTNVVFQTSRARAGMHVYWAKHYLFEIAVFLLFDVFVSYLSILIFRAFTKRQAAKQP